MYLVAVTRWGIPLEQEAPALAERLGEQAYDLKLRMARPLPVVLKEFNDAAEARLLLGELRSRGHGAVGCDAAMVPKQDDLPAVKWLKIGPRELVGSDAQEHSHAIAYQSIMGVFHAASIRTEASQVTREEKKLDLGRAVMTGGLMRNKKQVTVERAGAEQREQVLYIFRREGPEPMVLREHGLDYSCLGSARAPTTHANFNLLRSQLRAHAGEAFFDDRLFRKKRRLKETDLRGGLKNLASSHSNDGVNLLAAFLLMHGQMQGQL